MSETPKPALIVRRVSDREEVRRIQVAHPTRRQVEQCLSGLLRNMSPDYFVDDTEFDYLYATLPA